MFEIKSRLGSVTDQQAWAARGASFMAKVKATKLVWFPPGPTAAGASASSTATKATKRTTGAAKRTTGAAKKSAGAKATGATKKASGGATKVTKAARGKK